MADLDANGNGDNLKSANTLDKVRDGAPRYYIAIGTSAGGLEALQEFFQCLPADTGAGFIVIQHLSPDFKSVMDELLGRSTNMDVFNAVDGVTVQPNTVYLIPPRKNMMIAEGKLLLVDQMPDGGINFPIDIFFRALAEDQHHSSIGVVLSGTGSDGSRGIQAIKEVGGLVVVQDPKNAKFDGMPYNAVNSGFADVVLPASEMPGKLVNYMTHPLISGEGESLINYVHDNDSALKEIFSILRERSEIDFAQYKSSTVARRIERRIGINQLSSLQDYHALLIKSPQEISILAKDMLIGVTRFFRDPEAFDSVRSTIISGILDKAPLDEPIRIWVAGCSSGEEAYSIAILFDEEIKARNEARAIKIFATDVDPDAIAEAGIGAYPISVKDDIGEERLKRYFTLEDNHYVIQPAIRQMVIFAVHNLIKDPPFSNTHFTICRNVLIYFQHEAQKRVLAMLHFSLLKDGYLFLGASESLGELQSYFEVLHERNRMFKKVVTARVVTGTNVPIRHGGVPSDSLPTMTSLLSSYKGVDKPLPSTAVTDALIEDYVPPSIIINPQHEILHVFGDVSSYTRKIRSGKFSSSIKDIICDDLSIALMTALHRAEQQEDNVVYSDVKVMLTDQQALSINLKVRVVKDSRLNGINFIIIFENPKSLSDSETASIISYDANNQTHQRILDLEAELSKKQEHLQVTVEELETTNEELQSSNEELLAANEELQSTNEELQSVNEELYTVNSEYQEKIEELTQVNTDLDNIIKSTTIGIVFLDETMLIRNFTPASANHVNLLATDIGRPFHHIAHNLDYDTILKDISTVIDKATSIEKEVSTHNQGRVVVKIVPYYTEKSEAKGCVVSITDVTEIRRLQGALSVTYKEIRNSRPLDTIKENIRLLVVDDNKSDILHVNEMLAKYEKRYVIDEAHTPEAARACLTENQYDVCIIDYDLITEDAFSFIENLSQSGIERSDNAFVLLSGYVDEEKTDKALEMGIYDTINKNDLSPALLDKSIRYTIRHKRTEMYLSTQGKKLVASE